MLYTHDVRGVHQITWALGVCQLPSMSCTVVVCPHLSFYLFLSRCSDQPVAVLVPVLVLVLVLV